MVGQGRELPAPGPAVITTALGMVGLGMTLEIAARAQSGLTLHHVSAT